MAPTLRKKMSVVRGRKEGNYASSDQESLGGFTTCGLGLTLLPGSQVPRENGDEPKALADNPARELRSGNRRRGQNSQLWEMGNRQPLHENKSPPQRENSSRSARSQRSSTGSSTNTQADGRKLFNLEHHPLDGSYHSELRNGISYPAVSTSGVGLDCVDSNQINNVDAERSGNSLVRDSKRRRLEDSAVDCGTPKYGRNLGETCENQSKALFDGKFSDLHVEQENSLIGSDSFLNTSTSLPAGGKVFSDLHVEESSSGVAGSLGINKNPLTQDPCHSSTSKSSFPAAHRQKSVCASNNANLESDDAPVICSRPSVAAIILPSSARHQRSRSERSDQSHSISELFCEPDRSRPSLNVESRVNSDKIVSSPEQKVKRSFTSHLPSLSVSKAPSRANGKPSVSVTPVLFTTAEDRQQVHSGHTLLAPENLHELTLTPVLDYRTKYKLSDRLLDAFALRHCFDPAHTKFLTDSRPKRSSSLPNIPAMRAPSDLNPFESCSPATLLTPPRDSHYPDMSSFFSSPISYHGTALAAEQTTPVLPQTNTSLNNYNPQYPNGLAETGRRTRQEDNWSADGTVTPSDLTLHHESIPPISRHPQSKCQIPRNLDEGAKEAFAQQCSLLEIPYKANYSHAEVRQLILGAKKRLQSVLKTGLKYKSLCATLAKGHDKLRQDKAHIIQRLGSCEIACAKKDEQLAAMQSAESSLRRQTAKLRDERDQLQSAMRRLYHRGQPTAMIDHIIRTHPVNAKVNLGAPDTRSPGGQPGVNASSTIDPQACFQTLAAPYHTNWHIENTFTQPRNANMQCSHVTSLWDGFSERPIPLDSSTNQYSGPFVRPGITNIQADALVNGAIRSDPITIDLTDESMPSSALDSRDTSCPVPPKPSLDNQVPPFCHPPGQHVWSYCIPDSFPGDHTPIQTHQSQTTSNNTLPDQVTPALNPEGLNAHAEARKRLARKELSWLDGVHPFRIDTKTGQQFGLPSSTRASSCTTNHNTSHTQSAVPGSQTPVPKSDLTTNTKGKVSDKTKDVLSLVDRKAEEEKRRARAKGYRLKSAEKKRREKQLIQGSHASSTTAYDGKQGRRAAKDEKRQWRAQNPLGQTVQNASSGEQCAKTPDGFCSQFGQNRTQGSPDDLDSLFGDDDLVPMEEDMDPTELLPPEPLHFTYVNDSQYGAMHAVNSSIESTAGEENVSPAAEAVAEVDDVGNFDNDDELAAELEAALEAELEAEAMAGVEHAGSADGETVDPVVYRADGRGLRDESWSEESEEE